MTCSATESNTAIVNEYNNDEKHITFETAVKCVYFDIEEPIVNSPIKNLQLTRLNDKDQKCLDFCTFEQLKLCEYLETNSDNRIRIDGSVLVKNISFEKRVTIRYTIDAWESFEDTNAFYIDSRDSEWDRFAFIIRIDQWSFEESAFELTISFAIRYETDNFVVWDNNEGKDHTFLLHNKS